MNQKSLVIDTSIDPVVPDDFWSYIPLRDRPEAHLRWLGKPFIRTVDNPHFPGGNRYDIYCLESGGSSDRPTLWGMFGTMEEAVQRAKDGPPWRGTVPRRTGSLSESGEGPKYPGLFQSVGIC